MTNKELSKDLTTTEEEFLVAVAHCQAVGSLRLLSEAETPQPIHMHTEGLYSRTLAMPKGSVWLSRKHLTRHQYVVSDGLVEVYEFGKGWEIIENPHIGITEPGTQRVLKILDDCVWTTFHATDEKDPQAYMEQVTEPVPETLKAALKKLKEGFVQ